MNTKNDKSFTAQPLRSRRDYGEGMMDYDSSQLKVIPVEPEQKIDISELDYDGKIIPKPKPDSDQDIPAPAPPPPPIGEAEVMEEDAPMTAPLPQPGMLGCPMCGQRARIRGDIRKLPPRMTCPHCGVSYPKNMVQSCGDGTFKFAAVSPRMEKAWQSMTKKDKDESSSEAPAKKEQRKIKNFLTEKGYQPTYKLLVNVTKNKTRDNPKANKLLDVLEESIFEPMLTPKEDRELRKKLRDLAEDVSIPYATFVTIATDPTKGYSDAKKIADQISPLPKTAVYEKAAAILELAKEFALLIKG